VAKNGNNVEATFDFVAFENVALTLLLVWSGLYFDEVERFFDILAVFGNSVEVTFDLCAEIGNNVKRVLR